MWHTSLRQGCPFIMLLFLIGIEPLTQKILSSTKIQGISLGSTSLKVSHYVDDLPFLSLLLTPLIQSVRLLKNSFLSLGSKSTNPKPQSSLIPLFCYHHIVLLFHKEKFFHLQKFLELISPFKAKIYPKTGMTSFPPSLTLLLLPSIRKTLSFPKLPL